MFLISVAGTPGFSDLQRCMLVRACVPYARKLDINNTKTEWQALSVFHVRHSCLTEAQYEILEHVEQGYHGAGKYLDKKKRNLESA